MTSLVRSLIALLLTMSTIFLTLRVPLSGSVKLLSDLQCLNHAGITQVCVKDRWKSCWWDQDNSCSNHIHHCPDVRQIAILIFCCKTSVRVWVQQVKHEGEANSSSAHHHSVCLSKTTELHCLHHHLMVTQCWWCYQPSLTFLCLLDARLETQTYPCYNLLHNHYISTCKTSW